MSSLHFSAQMPPEKADIRPSAKHSADDLLDIYVDWNGKL